jgi:hypothetical protein
MNRSLTIEQVLPVAHVHRPGFLRLRLAELEAASEFGIDHKVKRVWGVWDAKRGSSGIHSQLVCDHWPGSSRTLVPKRR